VTTTRTRPWYCSRWVAPGACVVAAFAYLGVGLVGGERGLGLGGFVTMLVFGAAMLLAGRYSETVKGLLDHKDERINALDRGATVFTGVVLILVIIAMALIETARGEDGSPYFQLAGFAGVTYVASLLWLRWRH
jgi:hypothetical protein